jgi:hypothetical protein
MNTEIYSLWYKQPSMLTSTPTMARMIRTEGIEAYGLYIHFADTLHLVGGFQEYDFNDISLMLGYTKKLIKEKLNRVLNNYKLFNFYTDDDGIEYIGLERIKEDIASLNQHKTNGAKGGKKRAENYRDRQEQIKPVTENIETVTSKADAPSEICTNDDLKLPKWFLADSIELQKIKVRQMVELGKFTSEGERGQKMKEMMIKHIKNQE